MLPKSAIGEAFTSTTNQWGTLGVYVTDGRRTIDSAPAEQAIRPLCVGRRNWLHLGGDGGLRPTVVMLSVVASVNRAGVYPWAYPREASVALAARGQGADLSDRLPDVRTRTRVGASMGECLVILCIASGVT